jgi:uncharacterized phage protein (TIGR01671 family)
MREIKFRAWVTFSEKMIEPYSLEYLIWQKITDFPKKILEKEVIFMQYTGLLDKTGKEIYEGDIVETVYIAGKPHRGEVYFQPTRLNWSVKHSAYVNQDLFVYSRPDCSVEVIGNIYESQELLGVESATQSN